MLKKRSARGNRLVVFLDLGSDYSSVAGFVVVEGPGWRAAFRLWFVRGGGLQYTIADGADWSKIVENIAVVVEHLERTSIAQAETLSPPAPPWFASST
jgi:hypothetical protein